MHTTTISVNTEVLCQVFHAQKQNLVSASGAKWLNFQATSSSTRANKNSILMEAQAGGFNLFLRKPWRTNHKLIYSSTSLHK